MFETIDHLYHADTEEMRFETSDPTGSDLSIGSEDLELGLGKRLQLSENTNELIERLKEDKGGEGGVVEFAFEDEDRGGVRRKACEIVFPPITLTVDPFTLSTIQ